METNSKNIVSAWYVRDCNADTSSILQHEQILHEDLGCGDASPLHEREHPLTGTGLDAPLHRLLASLLLFKLGSPSIF